MRRPGSAGTFRPSCTGAPSEGPGSRPISAGAVRGLRHAPGLVTSGGETNGPAGRALLTQLSPAPRSCVRFLPEFTAEPDGVIVERHPGRRSPRRGFRRVCWTAPRCRPRITGLPLRQPRRSFARSYLTSFPPCCHPRPSSPGPIGWWSSVHLAGRLPADSSPSCRSPRPAPDRPRRSRGSTRGRCRRSRCSPCACL